MYVYYNNNPDNEKLPDCVIRAISLALDIPYYKTVSLLYENSGFYKCDTLCVSCYEKLLDKYCKNHYFGKGASVEEISNKYASNILLLRIDGHLTCSMYGNIYDIWNCSNHEVTDYWIIY